MCEVKLIKMKEAFKVIKELLERGVNVRLTVTGTSMYPFLREKIDSVELAYTNFKSIKCSDIVLVLRDNEQYILHRVLRKGKDCFYMVGDSQCWIEGPLRPDQLIAAANAVWRRNKRIECSNILWKFLSNLWLVMLPARGVIINTYKYICKIKTNWKCLYEKH